MKRKPLSIRKREMFDLDHFHNWHIISYCYFDSLTAYARLIPSSVVEVDRREFDRTIKTRELRFTVAGQEEWYVRSSLTDAISSSRWTSVRFNKRNSQVARDRRLAGFLARSLSLSLSLSGSSGRAV